MASTGDRLKATKAYVAAAIGFLLPGVTLLISEQNGDGIQTADLLTALLLCLAGATVTGGAVYATENKPKDPTTPVAPAGPDTPENWRG